MLRLRPFDRGKIVNNDLNVAKSAQSLVTIRIQQFKIVHRRIGNSGVQNVLLMFFLDSVHIGKIFVSLLLIRKQANTLMQFAYVASNCRFGIIDLTAKPTALFRVVR